MGSRAIAIFQSPFLTRNPILRTRFLFALLKTSCGDRPVTQDIEQLRNRYGESFFSPMSCCLLHIACCLLYN
jgi:hypothetical protein